MKKLILIIVSLMLIQANFAGEWKKVKSDKPSPAKITLVSSNIETSVIHFDIPGFYLDKVTTPKGTEFIVNLDETTPILSSGDPDLAKLTTSLMIPDLAQMDVEILSSNFIEFNNVSIAPSKGNFTRDIDPSTIPYTYGKHYQQDNFYPGKLAELRDPYIIRDFRGQTLIVYPFQYNPVTKTLKVYSEMEIKVTKTGNDGINPLIKTTKIETVNSQFNEIYIRQFLNYGNAKYTPVDEDGCMLIISYASFMTAMTDFVNWKKTIGIPVEMVDVATIGNAAAIKTYIANYYNTHNLAYVLLVGDAAQVPSSYSSGDSDNDYSYIVGTDHYPDIFIGRFSAESVAHVQTQVQRTIEYEQTPYTGIDWYTKCIGIASAEGPGDDSEYDYQHIRNQQTDLMNYNYTYNYELFDGTQGGNDAAGNPTPAMVSANINSGSSIIVYTGHGSDVSWSSSGFSSTNVAALTNTNKLPFIWSVACVNGNFVSTTCFAEAWMRSTSGNQPIGAIATLMSTINQSWNPPMEGQDEMVDILVESYGTNIKRTFGGLSMNGCMKMNDTYGADGDEMTDTWTVFGDPSIIVRTAVPQTLTVTHNPAIFLGAAQFTVFANKEGAKVCLTVNNEILGTGTINGGSATINFPAITNVGTLKVAVTAYNYIPYIGNVTITPASGPYLSYFSHSINDVGGNNNGQIDFGENILLSVAIKNIGTATAMNVNATIESTDPYITITDNTANYGNINAGETVSIPDGFSFSVAPNVPDNHLVLFTLVMTDSDDSWSTSFNEIIYAPLLEPSIGLTINDATGGNGNGRLDPGETATITAVVENNGHSLSPFATAVLSTVSPYITINSGSDVLGQIAAGSSASADFNITCSASTPVGQSVDLAMAVDAGNYGFSHTYFASVGLVLEDWELGNFTRFPWTFSGNANWTIANTGQYEGAYTAKSGVITHSQTSDMSVMLQVTTAGNISFYRKTSSEASYDYLRFFIDGVQQEQWAGEVAWGQVSYAVTAGIHNFKWTYYKDSSVSSGSDCAWVDYVIFPPSVIVAPEIVINPLSFNVTVAPDEIFTTPLTISNTGNLNLTWSAFTQTDSKNGGKAYCTSVGGGSDEFIQQVTFGSINNTTSQSYYADYTSLSTTVEVGLSYPITIINGDPSWSTDQCGIWIDWNQNENFADDLPITVSGSPGVGPYSASIVPPENALSGPTRMRVQIIYSSTPNSCLATFSYGEVEDYTVIVDGANKWLTIAPGSGTITQGNNQNPTVTFDATGLSDGIYTGQITVNSNDADEGQIVIPCTMNVSNGFTVNLTAMLEGPFSGSEMNTDINGILPLNQPYNAAPWNYSGTESVGVMPANAVDWVLVELRDAATAANANLGTRIARQAGLLLNNGNIVSTDGSQMFFAATVSNNLFVVVHHRSHLGILSAIPLTFSAGSYSYNFSTSATQAYGVSPQKQLASGVWGMLGGDADCNGEIMPADIIAIWKSSAGKTGYLMGDFNLDRQVDNADKDDCWFSNYGKVCQVP